MSRSSELSQCKQCRDNGFVGSLRRGFGGVLMITARRGARAVLWLRLRSASLGLVPDTVPPHHSHSTPTLQQSRYSLTFMRFSGSGLSFTIPVSEIVRSFPSFNCNAISLFHTSRVEMTVQLNRSFTEQMNIWLYSSFYCSTSRLPASTISKQAPVLGSYTSHKKLFYGYNVEQPHL